MHPMWASLHKLKPGVSLIAVKENVDRPNRPGKEKRGWLDLEIRKQHRRLMNKPRWKTSLLRLDERSGVGQVTLS